MLAIIKRMWIPLVVLIAVALAGIAVTIHARIDDWKRGRR